MARSFGDWQEARDHFRADKPLVLSGVQRNPRLLKDVSEELRADREVVLAAISGRPETLQYASDDLRADKSIVLEAVKRDGSSLQFAGSELQNEREVVLEAVQQIGRALKFASESCRSDKDIVLQAVRHDPPSALASPDIDPTERRERQLQMMQKAVPRPRGRFHQSQSFGRVDCALASASDALRADKDVVLAAVEYDGGALRHASQELRADREVVLAAIKQEGAALLNAAADFQKEKETVLLAARRLRTFDISSFCDITQAIISQKSFQNAFEAAIASSGEDAPVVSASLRKAEKNATEEEGQTAEEGTLECEVTLLSGASFACELPAALDGTEKRDAPTVNVLAKKILQELPKYTEMKRPIRVFINFSLDDEGTAYTASPWDWDQPLTKFLPPERKTQG